jgi:hypothetical protein
MGRPTKLNVALQKAICEHLKAGVFRGATAAAVCIDEGTLSRWYHRGAREEKGRYRDLFLEMNRAEAEFQISATDMLKAAAAQNPKYLMWLLSRRFPALYGRRDNIEEVNLEDRAADAQAVRELLFERLERLLPEIAKGDADAK